VVTGGREDDVDGVALGLREVVAAETAVDPILKLQPAAA
jgi:hypothetical protein